MTLVLDADCVGKRYGARAVLTSASLQAHAGRITALLGRNGAGKTTLLKICAGWIPADHGVLRYGGKLVERPRLYRLARLGLCYLPSDRGLLSLSFTVRRQLESVARLREPAAVGEVMDELELNRVADQRPQELSGGERRRASLALAWLLQPSCILADEPFRGIDPADRERVRAGFHRLAGRGCAVVASGHEVDSLLEFADDVVWVTSGTTHQLGSPREARRHWQFRREFLGSHDPGNLPAA